MAQKTTVARQAGGGTAMAGQGVRVGIGVNRLVPFRAPLAPPGRMRFSGQNENAPCLTQIFFCGS
jgi:hypothetical protein